MSHVTHLIDEVLTGRVLSAADDDAFRAHLRGCDDCRRQYDEKLLVLRATRGGEAAPGELERATVRAVRLATPVAASPSVFPWSWLFVGAAVAAAALVVLAATWPREQVGVVLVAGKGLTIDGVPATRDMVVLEDALIVSEKEDSALLLTDGTGKRGVLIRGGTRARIVSADEVKLEQGRVRVQVKDPINEMVVKTERLRVVQDTAGVFIVDEKPTGTLVAVHQGKVVVRGQEAQVEVSEGQETELTGTTLAPARPVASHSLVEDRGDGTVWGAIIRFLKQLVDVIGKALTGD